MSPEVLGTVWGAGSRSHPQGAQRSPSPCKGSRGLWEVSPLLVCSQDLGPGFVLQELLLNHVELLALGG